MTYYGDGSLKKNKRENICKILRKGYANRTRGVFSAY